LQLLQLLISGISQGCILGLVALGFVLIYKATETVNFAQGELMMLGASIAWLLADAVHWNVLAACAAAIVLMALGGLLFERLLLRPILGQPAFAPLLVTIGFGYFARGAVTMLPALGTETHALALPGAGQTLRLGDLVIGVEHLVIVAATLALCTALYLFFRYTRIGIAMQAVSQNQLAATYVGIPVQRLIGLVWALSAAVAAVAGILLAPFTFVHANMGLVVGLKAFPAAVVGGFGSVPGALCGGLVIGVVESLSGFYLPEGVKDVAAFVVVLVVLIVRPEGLFGERLRKKV